MPRNVLILGSGRSGTSLTAGLLSRAGYFMGERPVGSGVTKGNPKGQFEDPEVNAINEDLLTRTMRTYRHSLFHRMFLRSRRRDLRLHYYQRWLAPLPLWMRVQRDSDIEARIRALTVRTPFCFKDPRFSYTLHVWRPFVGNAAFVCVFRDPAVTAASIVAECEREAYLRSVAMDADRALRLWKQVYRHVLQIHYPAGGDWLFVHYNQLMDGTALPKIEKLLGVETDRGFVDPGLNRSRPSGGLVPSRVRRIYHQLCDQAGYEGR
jgi:Sulfotransferase family